MNIPDEIIKKGSIIIYNDSDREIIKDIDEYNKYMGDCRIKMKRVDEIKFGYIALNPLVISAMIAAEAASVFSHPVLAIVLLAAYSIIFVIFTLFKDNLVVSTIATVLLLILDLRFAILLIADIVLLVIHDYIEKPLKSQLSYPIFSDINVRYERFNCQNYENTNH
jgi:hypothetical protein